MGCLISEFFFRGADNACLLSLFRFVASTQGSNGDAQVSEEERAFRQQEIQILEKISAPPIHSENALKKLVEERKPSKKKDAGVEDAKRRA